MRLLNASGCLDALAAPEVVRGLDAYVTKTVTPLPREGNAPVRIAETELGMLNAIGLANPGIDAFLEHHLPRLAELGVPLWVSVGGFSLEDYVHVAGRLARRDEVETIELNLSCPNVDEVPENVGEVVAAVRAVTVKPLYAKLSAAVADLGATAGAAEAAGADGLSLVNTVKGLALDERTLQPVLARGAGGLSGPALRPCTRIITARPWPSGRPTLMTGWPACGGIPRWSIVVIPLAGAWPLCRFCDAEKVCLLAGAAPNGDRSEAGLDLGPERLFPWR